MLYSSNYHNIVNQLYLKKKDVTISGEGVYKSSLDYFFLSFFFYCLSICNHLKIEGVLCERYAYHCSNPRDSDFIGLWWSLGTDRSGGPWLSPGGSQGRELLQPPQDIIGGGCPSSLPGLTVTPNAEAPAKLYPQNASPEGSYLQCVLLCRDMGTRHWPNTQVMRGNSGLSMGQTERKYPSIPNLGAEP